MKDITIEELAYVIKEAKENHQSKPIFFLGAGASKSGNIPLAMDIVKDILEKYPDAPAIKKLKEEQRSYAKLMECLQPFQRDKLLKGYIDEAKINVTHIYLAQLIKHDFVDYVLTVNFDNLMLRALSLFNEFPSTYDMAILNDLTTSKFKEKSVVYLHGQHHGLWLLNTEEEMNKVNRTVPKIFDSIKDGRPWVFIGYSGEDPIFEHVKDLGRFDNGLYWVTYNDNNPNKKVKTFLETPNTNASIIKGYDADSFMLKLNTELGLEQPKIIDKPFSSIKEMLNNIVDIDDEEHFKGVKERLEISKSQVEDAINQFEEGKLGSPKAMQNKSEIDILKREMIDMMISNKFNIEAINLIEEKANRIKDSELNNALAILYYDWGTFLGNLALTKEVEEAEVLYKEAFEKFKKAIEIKPDYYDAFYNWGTVLGNLAKIKEGDEVEVLHKEAIGKYKKVIETKPNDHEAFLGWGTALGKLAETKEGDEAESLFKEAFEKFKKAIEIKPDFHESFNNWGAYIGRVAQTKKGKEAESLFKKAFEKFKKASEIKPDFHESFNNWGTYLGELANTKEGDEVEVLYNEAIGKYKKAIEIKPNNHKAFENWGNALGDLANTKEGKEAESLFKEAFEKFKKASEIKPDYHKAFYNWGTYLGNLAKTKEGEDAEVLYKDAFEKFKKASEIKPDFHEAFNNWGTYLGNLAKTKEGEDAEVLYKEAFDKLKMGVQHGGESYNLACAYALKKEKENALKYLNISLEKKEIKTDFVQKDEDWKHYLKDKYFIALMEKYKEEE